MGDVLFWIILLVLGVPFIAMVIFAVFVAMAQPTEYEKRKRNEAYVWARKGMDALVKFKDHDRAIYCFERALKINPEEGTAWYGLAKVHIAKGDYEKALEYFDKATRYNDWRNYWEEKGDLLAKMGRYSDAMNAYDRAIYLGDDEDERRIEEKKRRLRG